jgi:subtilase family protein
MLTRRTTRLALVAATALACTALTTAPPALAGNPASGASALSAELTAAWRITEGRGVTVAVLDTGVDQVQQLTGRLAVGPDYAPQANEDKSEGTTLAVGIAGSGSTSSGAFGQIGRAPEARILSVRVTPASSAGASHYFQDGVWQQNEARGIRYAVQHGAQVITLENLGYDDDAELLTAVSLAVTRGVVIVTSADGFGSTPNGAEYPASLPGVVNVSYLVLHGEQSPGKHEGPAAANTSVLLTAPANSLPVDGPGSEPYTMFNQESALAWAAGTVALIKSKYPHLAPALVVRALAQSAQDAPRGGYSTTTGFGLIDPLGALKAAGRLTALTQTVGSPTTAVQVYVGSSQNFGGGTRLPVIEAVHHSVARLAAYYALIGLGLVLLILAVVLMVRKPRSTTAVPPQSAV